MGLGTADLVAAKGKKEISVVCTDPYKNTITTKEVHQVGSISPYAENLKIPIIKTYITYLGIP